MAAPGARGREGVALCMRDKFDRSAVNGGIIR